MKRRKCDFEFVLESCLLREGVREKLLCPISRVDTKCLEWSNMEIQNAISILSNTINNNSIQKLKNTQHMSWCNHHLECFKETAVSSNRHTYLG